MLMETAALSNILLESRVLDSQWLSRLSPIHRCVSCVRGPHILFSSVCNALLEHLHDQRPPVAQELLSVAGNVVVDAGGVTLRVMGPYLGSKNSRQWHAKCETPRQSDASRL